MACYSININTNNFTKLDGYRFKNEGHSEVSPQKLLKNYTDLITDIVGLDLLNTEIIYAIDEFPTHRGPIDILYVGSNAEIVIIETKLLRNPESTRTVVAQVLDYVKALSNESIESFAKKLSLKQNGQDHKLMNDLNYRSLIQENLRTGNFKVLIVGDAIHPNVIGMVDSIHSAPHLSFSLYLVELDTYIKEQDVVIMPRVVAQTTEVERSVIRIEIDPKELKYEIQAETPSETGKGTRPILTWEQYLENIQNMEFSKIINEFKSKWVQVLGDNINMGQVGFSAGIIYGERRVPIQYVYDNRITIITDKAKDYSNIPDKLYEAYKNNFKSAPAIYDKYIVGNKATIYFDTIDAKTLTLILDSSFDLAKKMKEIDEN